MRVSTCQGDLEVRRFGRGRPTAIALHPLALSGELWSMVPTGHEGELCLLAPDARGHGSSAWDERAFLVEDLADDAATVIEHLDNGPMDVLGLSMGGSTALVLAARRPELVRRLVIADATASYGDERVERWGERARLALEKPREEQLVFQVDRWFGQRFREVEPATVTAVSDLFVRTSGTVHAAACHALGALDATEMLFAIRAPTLVLVGSEDYATPVAMAEELASRVSHAKLAVLPLTRHLSLLESPRAWQMACEFLG